MPRIPIFRLGGAPEKPALPDLSSSTPYVSLEGLALGVDNLRHDVILSTRVVEAVRAQVARLIARHGELDGLLSAEAPVSTQGPSWMRTQAGKATKAKNDPAEWKALLTVTKFLRTEMNLQFAQVLERCRVAMKSYDNTRHQRAHEYQERVAGFQVRKKI